MQPNKKPISEKCKYCDKVIYGFSEKQINYLMMQHMLAKHSDKIKKI